MKICPSFLIAWAPQREVNSSDKYLLRTVVYTQTQDGFQTKSQTKVCCWCSPGKSESCCAVWWELHKAASSGFCPVEVSLSLHNTTLIFAAPARPKAQVWDALSIWNLAGLWCWEPIWALLYTWAHLQQSTRLWDQLSFDARAFPPVCRAVNYSAGGHTPIWCGNTVFFGYSKEQNPFPCTHSLA